MYGARYCACIGIGVIGSALLAFGILAAHVTHILMPERSLAEGMWLIAGMFIVSGALFSTFGIIAAFRWRRARRSIWR